jgi:hypothetical protein
MRKTEREAIHIGILGQLIVVASMSVVFERLGVDLHYQLYTLVYETVEDSVQ